jgi:hypothetical protein
LGFLYLIEFCIKLIFWLFYNKKNLNWS